MKRVLYASAVLALIVSAILQARVEGQTAGRAAAAAASAQSATASLAEAQQRRAVNPQQELLNTYCTGCHNSRAKVGGLALDGLDLQAAADNAEIWETALR